jgi:uncharacterized protein (TIGR02246 family)
MPWGLYSTPKFHLSYPQRRDRNSFAVLRRHAVRKRLTAVILLTILVAVPSEGQVTGRNAIEQVLTDFVAAFNAKDAAKLASFYAEDAVLMPPGSPVVKGQPAIKSVFMAMVARGGVVKFNAPLAIDVTGDRAVAAGTYTVTVSVTSSQTAGGNAPLMIGAKYLTVFSRVGNAWKIIYDMQNADETAPR